MSSRPKALLKHSKQKQKKQQILETADDYQAAGVDFEDAAGKWRAGDAVKSMRFFHRALEVYEEGLRKFPQSFDLAYNKARVQLEISTHPLLVKHLQQPLLTALEAALESHRYALKLNQDNPDTLFNTAQVLTSVAEELAKNDAHSDLHAIQYLEEALELHNRCLELQELQYDEYLEQQRRDEAQQFSQSPPNVDDMDEEDGGARIGASKDEEEQWFSIVEPVTKDTLIDTVLAQLGTLTTLCGVLSNSPDISPPATLAWIEEYSSTILGKKLPLYVDGSDDRVSEIALVKSNFVSALLEAGFRAGKIDSATYKRERDGAFSVAELGLERSAETLLANAKSLFAFNAALADLQQEDVAASSAVRWNALSASMSSLIAASKVEVISAEDVATTHLLRGDCSMLQHQMGLPPFSYQSAVANAPQLLRNAQVFYRNASKLSPEGDIKAIADFRSAIAEYLQSHDKSNLASAIQRQGNSWVAEQLEDMVLEGLLPAGFPIP